MMLLRQLFYFLKKLIFHPIICIFASNDFEMDNTIDNTICHAVDDFFNVSKEQLENINEFILQFNITSFDIIRLIVFLEEKYSIKYNSMHYCKMTSLSAIIQETKELLK